MFVNFLCAVITRSLFILVSLIGVWRVTWVKNNTLYWLLIILFLPLVVELILTLRRRKGKDYKWFSPAVFLFLISIIPTIWILELHHQQNTLNTNKCRSLDSSESINDIVTVLKNSTNENSTSMEMLMNSAKLISSVCPNDWILALHQIVIILLIVGKWILPTGGITRDQLSQLLLIFVGTSADILEFTSETLSDVKNNNQELVYVVLSIWTWSMLQFPFNLTVVNPEANDEIETQSGSLLLTHRRDFWSAAEDLLIKDGPFLLVRLIVMIRYQIIHQMLVFFTLKNFMVVSLNVYRLWVIFWDSR
ncbi:transmembrane protein 26b isoform X1 [Brachyhypopomus gauderio]|uniref:transmembrane protein 26b isoform X1 n=1 Tax=Brachyhypopomus gauderio TaxID=698409 RepID=UPI004042876E